MSTNQVYLSLGSNIEPEKNIIQAVNLLQNYGKLCRISTAWESKPIGFEDQPDFINAVVLVETKLSALEFRNQAIAQIEKELGRVRQANKNAPRTMDIDIMLFNHDIFTLGNLQIPNPEVLTRPFVAIPLAEIAPDYIHPQTGETLRKIADQFELPNPEIWPRLDLGLSRLIPETPI